VGWRQIIAQQAEGGCNPPSCYYRCSAVYQGRDANEEASPSKCSGTPAKQADPIRPTSTARHFGASAGLSAENNRVVAHPRQQPSIVMAGLAPGHRRSCHAPRRPSRGAEPELLHDADRRHDRLNGAAGAEDRGRLVPLRERATAPSIPIRKSPVPSRRRRPRRGCRSEPSATRRSCAGCASPRSTRPARYSKRAKSTAPAPAT
jgi:hypothetical protein